MYTYMTKSPFTSLHWNWGKHNVTARDGRQLGRCHTTLLYTYARGEWPPPSDIYQAFPTPLLSPFPPLQFLTCMRGEPGNVATQNDIESEVEHEVKHETRTLFIHLM